MTPVTPVRLEPATLRSRVKHSTTEPLRSHIIVLNEKIKLEDLTVLKRPPDLRDNVKIGQDQLELIMKHILFYVGCGHFGQVT